MIFDSDSLHTKLIDSIARLHASCMNKRHMALSELIPAINKNASESRQRNNLDSCDLNVFRFFNVNETTHSRLLAYFLDPQETHGQGSLFLLNLLKLVNISEPQDNVVRRRQ